MKIVNAMFGRGKGGIEQALVDYCEALQLAGHDVMALIHPGAAIREALGMRGIPYRTLANFGAWDPIAIFRLRQLLATLSPDAAIAHGNRAVSLLAAAGARHLIAPMHNYKIKCAGVSAVFAPTEDLMRYAESQGVARDRIYHIPNMVRAPVTLPSRKLHSPPVIGTMGRFVAKKGFNVFIEALGLLQSRGVPFRAVLAGDGEEAHWIKTFVASKGLSSVLTFPGWVEDKQTFFDSIDIFCLPSHHEPFGIVLLEAMAQGLPVISTDSEGPSEIIENGVNGILVPKGDAAALAGGLSLLLADQAKADMLARNAYATVKRDYDLLVISARLALALHAVSQL